MTQRYLRHVSWDSPLNTNWVTGQTSATVLRMPSTRFSKSTRLKRGCCLSLLSSAANMSSWCFSIDPEQPHEGSVTKQNHHNNTWTSLFHSPARDGLWLWFSNICTDSPTKRIFSATRTGMYEGSISTRKENCCRDGASMFSSSISLYRETVTNRKLFKPRKWINYDNNSQPVTPVNC